MNEMGRASRLAPFSQEILMRVKALVCIAGENAINVNDEVEMDDAEAIRHIEAGHVVPVSEVKIERAVKVPAETRKRKK
jgi:hypothetical protein